MGGTVRFVQMEPMSTNCLDPEQFSYFMLGFGGWIGGIVIYIQLRPCFEYNLLENRAFFFTFDVGEWGTFLNTAVPMI